MVRTAQPRLAEIGEARAKSFGRGGRRSSEADLEPRVILLDVDRDLILEGMRASPRPSPRPRSATAKTWIRQPVARAPPPARLPRGPRLELGGWPDLAGHDRLPLDQRGMSGTARASVSATSVPSGATWPTTVARRRLDFSHPAPALHPRRRSTSGGGAPGIGPACKPRRGRGPLSGSGEVSFRRAAVAERPDERLELVQPVAEPPAFPPASHDHAIFDSQRREPTLGTPGDHVPAFSRTTSPTTTFPSASDSIHRESASTIPRRPTPTSRPA